MAPRTASERRSVRKETVTSGLQLQKTLSFSFKTYTSLNLGRTLEPPGKNSTAPTHALASALCFPEQVSQPYGT